MKKICFGIIVLFVASAGWAGDVATFKNLGFSPDSRYFQFAQYGIDGTTQNPYAEIFTVDVPKNDFVPSGNVKDLYPVGTTLGDDGLKALFALMEKTTVQRKTWKLDYLQQGRPIYFRVVSENTAQDFNNFQVLDYKTGREYAVQLKETGTDGKSMFSIDLSVKDKAGKVLGTYKVGHPTLVRKNVQKYTVVQMILTPNERALVFVVEREESDGQGGVSVRSMVETVTF